MDLLSFQQCYEILGLQNQDDLVQAETSYRLLVQQWHPDRYQGDDPSEATRRYIEITKAFKKLREFHKDNNSLPFSSIDNVAGATSTFEKQPNHVANNKQKPDLASRPDTGNGLAVNRTAARKIANAKWTNKERFRPSRFALAISAVFVVGVSLILLFMTKLDRINSDRVRDEARLERISERLVEQPDTYK